MGEFIPAAKPEIGIEEEEAVIRVLKSGNLAQGSEVAAFEAEFAEAVVNGVEHCVAVNSGTSALHLMLLAAGIGAGDEVLVPSFTFAATANAVAMTGATPIFVDIDRDTFNMSPSAAEAAITPRTSAVMPVHLYGLPADMAAFVKLCQRHDLALFEDAAQAHMASVGGQRVGTFGHAAAFSFYPTKNMTSGEGGMVTTTDAQLARRVRLLRNQGQEVRYRNEIIGVNNRMTDLHAAIGRVQLRKLPDWTFKRREIAAYYQEGLMSHVNVPQTPFGYEHVFHQYTIRVDGAHRDTLVERLNSRGVGTGVYYPTPTHRLPAYSVETCLPETDLAAKEVMSLPVYPSLDRKQLLSVVESLKSAISESV